MRMSMLWRRFVIITVGVSALALVAAVVLSSLSAPDDPAAVIAEAETRLEASRTAAAASAPALPWIQDQGAVPDGMEKAAENGRLTLFMDRQTTSFAVRHKESGRLWYSNPTSRESDPIASGVHKDRLSSLFFLSYLLDTGQEQEYDSYADSVALGQFETEPIENGVKVTYTVGQVVRGIESIPRVMTGSRFEERIISRLSDERAVSEMKKRFKYEADRDVYTRRELPSLAVSAVLDILNQVGYGEEDLAYDDEENGLEPEAGSGRPRFSIPVEYRLDGEQFVVRIDAGAIEKTGTMPLHTITLLEFFGAADSLQSGYMFVPDGSGALIRLNNGRTVEPPYLAPVYGEDGAIARDEKLAEHETVRLPVFGMKAGDAAWLGIIEQGDAIASIKADIAGRLNGYNYIAPSFTLASRDKVIIAGNSATSTNPVHQKTPYGGDIVVRYGFLADDKADYSGMAALYRDYLAEHNRLRRLEPAADTPFVLELVGGMETRKSMLGVPYDAVTPLTTLDQALEVLAALRKEQVAAVKLRYMGWFNGGTQHRYPSRVVVGEEIGGRATFTEFAQKLHGQGVRFYPDAAFLNVYTDGHGFRAGRDAIKYMSQKTASVYRVDRPSFILDGESFSHYPLSPVRLPAVIRSFTKAVKPLGIGGLSLRDLGDTLYSDFDQKKPADRQQSAVIVGSQLIELSADFPDLMASGGNAYLLPYAQTIVNAPAASSGFNLEDESVPFYQMVLHGYADLAGLPFNQADDQSARKNILKAIETGSNVYYRWVYSMPSELKSPAARELYAAGYADWVEEAAAAYKEVNEALKPVRHLRISRHEKLSEGVYRTTYEDGTAITVNYNDKPVSPGGYAVGALSYRIGGK
ncbi:DUF5696 domain-containing protein [Paenibacillus sp. EZ-K15]|uniref:DUF5696 domain-containing protein n=1 Tax=Paenibacillus sp. EZ-K15 TaxID=2044275 RepID=UPI000BFA9DE3|nr:DUF5696 domain-containing protein [Paenibacillus sp. EZ-K15]